MVTEWLQNGSNCRWEVFANGSKLEFDTWSGPKEQFRREMGSFNFHFRPFCLKNRFDFSPFYIFSKWTEWLIRNIWKWIKVCHVIINFENQRVYFPPKMHFWSRSRVKFKFLSTFENLILIRLQNSKFDPLSKFQFLSKFKNLVWIHLPIQTLIDFASGISYTHDSYCMNHTSSRARFERS